MAGSRGKGARVGAPHIGVNGQLLVYFGIFLGTLVLAFLGTRGALFLAHRFDWTAKSNARSSHEGKLAYGGGGPVLLAALAVWAFLVFPLQPAQLALLAGVSVLAVVSWLDDLNSLASGVRLAVQVGVVVLGVGMIGPEERVFGEGFPFFLERLLMAYCWLWFINLFNFMDGIDGLAGVETLFVGLGVFLVFYLTGGLGDAGVLALALAGAIGGFLPWNWHRAKIMLGDLGSIPIGFLLGYVLIELALSGHLLPALILPSYFVVDATLTILRRLFERKKIAQAHREHFYQRASPSGAGHDRVVVRVGIANLFLVGFGVLAISYPLAGVAGAVLVNGLLLLVLHRLAQNP